jgi:hypothetical protein
MLLLLLLLLFNTGIIKPQGNTFLNDVITRPNQRYNIIFLPCHFTCVVRKVTSHEPSNMFWKYHMQQSQVVDLHNSIQNVNSKPK